MRAKLRHLITVSLLVLLFFSVNSSSLSQSSLPAFPGAEGFGAYSVGGRGGRVIKVTNLNDSGPGSLRAAVEASGPRIVVFDTGGEIVLNNEITVENPYITIAGQTAPGDGITLRKEQLRIRTHDVIVRGIRVRVGDEGSPTCCRDGINITTTGAEGDVYNVILDHNSVSWGIDENINTWKSSSRPHDLYNITLQYNIISEALHDSIHVDEGASTTGPHSMGALLGQEGAHEISFHHNLIAHSNDRNPRLQGIFNVDVVNNVIYDWGSHAVNISDNTPLTANIVGNYIKSGVGRGSGSPKRDITFGESMKDGSKIYIANNYADSDVTRSVDSTEKTRYPEDDPHAVILWQNNNNIDNWYTDSPPHFKSNFPVFSSTITTQSALDAYENVLVNAGTFKRDSVDARVVESVRDRTGKIIDSQNEVGGWPILNPGIPIVDNDDDGMPDSWELERGGSGGLNPSDISPSGYTWVEEYINSLVGSSSIPPSPSTSTPLPDPGSGGSEIALNPSDDTYVDERNPNTNYGSLTRLETDGSPIKNIYMKFNLSSIQTNIISAKLRMRVYNPSGSTQALKYSSDDWNENSVTYNFKPAPGETIASINGGSLGEWKEIDVTEAVLGKAGGVISFVIDSAGSDGLDFYSKENQTDIPQLVINYSSDVPSTPTASPTPYIIPGDANNDGIVNEIDYTVWQENYLSSVQGGYSQGDFNLDGTVDGVDYTIWITNYTI